MRHVLKAEHIETVTVEYSHGRTSAHSVDRVVCVTCGEVIVERKEYGIKKEDLERLTEEHNFDKIFAELAEIKNMVRYIRNWT